MKHAKRVRENGSSKSVKTQLETAPEEPRIKPFGLIEPSHDIEMARYHICDTYSAFLKTDIYQGASALHGLNQCIRHNPGLQSESRALAAICDGADELVNFDNAVSRERGIVEWTGLETWLCRKLRGYEKNPAEETLRILEEVELVLREQPSYAALASAIQRILWAAGVMRAVHRWQESL